MSRNTLFTLIFIILVIGLLGMGAYFYFSNKTTLPGSDFGKAVREFLPFGNQPAETTRPKEAAPEEIITGRAEEESGRVPRFAKLVKGPIAGFVSGTIASTTIVRYMEKETGRVYEIDMSLPAVKNKITNTTIPSVHQAFFGKNGSSVIIRYLDVGDTVQTYYANIPAATSSEAIAAGVPLRGNFLPPNINDLSISPSFSKIFTLVGYGNSSIGTVSNPDGSKKSQIFDSPFTEWLSSWANENTVLLVTKPSYAAPGYAYTLDSKSGAFKKLYGGTYGLSAVMSPDGKRLLISENDGSGSPSIKIYGIAARSLAETGLRTVSDKCFFASSVVAYCAAPNSLDSAPGGYPDAWYQGIVSFSDSIWKIDSELASINKIADVSKDGREDIDAVNLSASKDGGYLFFTNKRNDSLWALKLEK